MTTIGSGVFKKHEEIVSVTIPNGVTTIESEAFEGCTNLQSVVLPDSVTYIGAEAFYGCKNLANVTLSNSLTGIADKAFYNCSGLIGISIPGSVTSIGNSAFYGCKSMGSIEIGNGVQDIGKSAFSNNDKVISVVIPDSVTNLGSEAFNSCDSLKNFVFSKSLTIIPQEVLSSCKKLEKLEIPQGVQMLERGIVSSCNNLKYLAIPDSVISMSTLGYYSETPNKELFIYCNEGSVAYNYAVENGIFYKPLENFASDSSGSGSSSGDTNTGTTGENNNTQTDQNTGNSAGTGADQNTGNNTNTETNQNAGTNQSTTGTGSNSNSSESTTEKKEVTVQNITCVNRCCIKVKFSDEKETYITVSKLQQGINSISFKYDGKNYTGMVDCNVGFLSVTSIKAVGDNLVQITYSGQFAKDKNGADILPKFTVVGLATAKVTKTDGSIVLQLNGTTYENAEYLLQADYEEGFLGFAQTSFRSYKKEEVINELVNNSNNANNTNSTNNTTLPSDWDPVDDSNQQNSYGNSDNDYSNDNSVTGWDDSEEEIPVKKNPKLSKKSKTIKKGKTFMLYLKKTTFNAKWKTSNKKIAKITYKSGKYVRIKGRKKGTAYITASVDGKLLRCKVKVK